MLRSLLRVLGLFGFTVIGLPCLFFAQLGLRGRLSDTSQAENFEQGLMFLSFAILTTVPAIFSLFPRFAKRESRDETRRSEDPP